MKTMKVVIPGVLTTVQDLGRFGYQKSGMTCSGVMETAAYRKANYLVGHEEGAAVLEMTLYGGSCRFEEDTVIALTGADMQPTVNQKPIAMNQAVKVPEGGVLNLGMAKTGCRTYLAVAGGFEVPKVMGSYSTNLKCGIGGHEGRALQMGDELPIGEALHSWDEVKDRKVSVPDYPKEVLVSVVPGPQEEYFTEAGIHHFYSESYEVTESCDRMGYRLEGPEVIGITDLMHPDFGDMVTIHEGEVPVFWPCGVTPQNVIMDSKPDFCITHAPGHMLVTDVKNINLKY